MDVIRELQHIDADQAVAFFGVTIHKQGDGFMPTITIMPGEMPDEVAEKLAENLEWLAGDIRKSLAQPDVVVNTGFDPAAVCG